MQMSATEKDPASQSRAASTGSRCCSRILRKSSKSLRVGVLSVLPENISNPNAVKVVTATDGRALYFSRATIPYDRDAALAQCSSTAPYWKHIGLYAYRRSALERFPSLPPSTLERTERLEQLRFLENGINLYVEPTEFDTVGVDTEADVKVAELMLLART